VRSSDLGPLVLPLLAERRQPASHVSASSTHPASASTHSAEPAATQRPALPAGQQAFVAAIRTNLSEHGYSNTSTDQQIAAVGTSICSILASGIARGIVAASLGRKPEADADMTGKRLVNLANSDICPRYRPKAQLQGSGEVNCKILVNGRVVATGHASGGFNIAMCEISQDPLTGQWQNDS
jgi:Protein of unknown function (DUF732)